MSTGSLSVARPVATARPGAAGPPPQALPAGLASLPPGPRLSAALASVDPRRLTAHQLAIVIATQSRQIAHEQARLLDVVWELGHSPLQVRDVVVRDVVVRDAALVPFAMVEAAQAGRWTQQRANETRDLALFVREQVPALGEAMMAGHVDLEKVKIFKRLLAGVVDVALMRAIVALALPAATHSTAGTLRSRLYRLRCKLSPDSVRRQRERDHAARYLGADREIGGLVTLVARFCDEQAATAALEHINAIATATRAAGDPQRRSIDQLRNDIAVSLLAGVDPSTAGFATPADRKGTITLTLPLVTLTGLSTSPGRPGTCEHSATSSGLCRGCLTQLADLTLEPGDLAGYGPVTAHIARQTAAQLAQISTWRFAVTDAEGQQIAEGTIPTNLLPDMAVELRRWAADTTAGPDGRAHRRPNAAQTAFVRARDRHCRAPGCRIPAYRCQIDHRIPWHRGGPTLIDNLYSLCRHHHRAKDEAGFTYQPFNGGLRWRTPGGHTYLTRHRDDDARPGRRPLTPRHRRERVFR